MLQQGEFNFDQLRQTLYEYQPDNSEQITDYEVYVLDFTSNERPEAVTLEDRGSLKTQKNEPVRYMITGILGWNGSFIGKRHGQQRMFNEWTRAS